MRASIAGLWWARVVVVGTVALVVVSEGRAENRGPMTSPSGKNPSNGATGSKFPGDAKPKEDLADDDSIKKRPTDDGKNAKKKKSKTVKPGAAAPSGRGRSPRMIVENTPMMSGGGGGFSSEA